MLLSEKIVEALKYTMISLFGNDRGNQRRFAAYLGVSTANISRWLNLDVSSIEGPIWEKIKDKLQYPPPDPNEAKASKILEMKDILHNLAPGKQIVTGVINVGISANKIVKVINSSNLSERQKNELIEKIFCEGETQ